MTRVNKYLSEVGFCSRRAADRLIQQGRVTINGRVPEMGTRVAAGDEVRVDGKSIASPSQERVYIVLNKPAGIVCTTDVAAERDNIIDFVGHPERIFPVGRLDKASEGLIFLTNDGDIVNKILRAGNKHDKEYVVTVDRRITDGFVRRMSRGVPILDTVTDKCRVEALGSYTFRIVLTQGLNRQIRRMCEALGYMVTRLERVRIMNVELDIPLGEWRDLTTAELAELNRLTADSSKTAPPPRTPSPSGGSSPKLSRLVLFNKPYGVLSQFTSKDGFRTLADFIDVPEVYAAGRLDKDSEGLLVLTDDGALQNRIASPRHKMSKTYWAQVEGEPDEEAIDSLRAGVQLKDGRTRPAEVERIPEPPVWPRTPPIRERKSIPTAWLQLTISEGRNRQVRRMTAAVGHPTLRLIRYAVGNWTLDGLDSGASRELEVEAVRTKPRPRRGPRNR